MYATNEIMFPYEIISDLKDLRGEQWQALVERISAHSEYHEETLAFMLMMIRLNGCLLCETDSYRAMRGCLPCAVQTLRRHKGTDAELLALFDQALVDVQNFAKTHKQAHILREKLTD